MDSIYEKIWNMDMEKNPYLSYLPNSGNNIYLVLPKNLVRSQPT